MGLLPGGRTQFFPCLNGLQALHFRTSRIYFKIFSLSLRHAFLLLESVKSVVLQFASVQAFLPFDIPMPKVMLGGFLSWVPFLYI